MDEMGIANLVGAEGAESGGWVDIMRLGLYVLESGEQVRALSE